MPKVSPNIRALNGGVFSELMMGRVDIDRYQTALRKSLNVIPTPQGPALRRGGTSYRGAAYDQEQRSALIPFIFSEENAFALEFADHIMCPLTPTGPLTRTTNYNVTVVQTAPLVVNSPTPLTVGWRMGVYNANPMQPTYNQRFVVIAALGGNDYLLDVQAPGGLPAGTALILRRQYTIVTPYAAADLKNLRYTQDNDRLFLWCTGYRPQELLRYGTYDWRISEIDWSDGPYMAAGTKGVRITNTSTGNAIPLINAPSASVTSSGDNGTDAAWKAFDRDKSTYWRSSTVQTGWIAYDFGAPTVVIGYTIHVGSYNENTNFSAVDCAPGDWTFEGWDGAQWVVLHSVFGYVLYENKRSVFFKINNTTAYTQYRLNVTAGTRNGNLNIVVGNLSMKKSTANTTTLTISATTDVNKDAGFVATDVDRLLRIKDIDGNWRKLKITAVNSATQVVAEIIDDPFFSNQGTTEWRMAYFSDTTGWPTCGAIFDDRLWMGGVREHPTLFVFSETGNYTSLAPSGLDGVVVSTNGFAQPIRARRGSRIVWMASDENGVIIGTGSEAWMIRAVNTAEGIGPANVRARRIVARGANSAEVLSVDRQILYVQRGGRNLREMAYVFEADGYKSISLSIFASHLGIKRFAEIDYAAEPHSIVWVRTEDDKIRGLTYNREENVIGWHEHEFGSEIESMCVLPAPDGLHDQLWMAVCRRVGGVEHRYFEVLDRPWDFDFDFRDDANYVDSYVRIELENPVSRVYGFPHLVGEKLAGVADGVLMWDVEVKAGGYIDLPQPAKQIVAGLPYDFEIITTNIEAGAADGTAQGKQKRIHAASIQLWESAYGEIGTYNEDRSIRERTDVYDYAPIEYPQPQSEIVPVELQTVVTEPILLHDGHNKRACIAIRLDGRYAVPLNVVAIMPRMVTNDG